MIVGRINKKGKYGLSFLMLLIFLISTINFYAQSNESHRINTHVEGGYIFGGMIYNYNFIYNPAYFINISAIKPITSKVSTGLSVGYIHFQENERLYPIKLKIIGFTKNRKDCMFYGFSTGYSFVHDLDFDSMEDYDFKGGILFEFGIGRRFNIYNTDLLIGVSYLHQFARIKYKLPDGKTVTEPTNYDLLKFNIGFIF